jgi:hypothetical protein
MTAQPVGSPGFVKSHVVLAGHDAPSSQFLETQPWASTAGGRRSLLVGSQTYASPEHVPVSLQGMPTQPLLIGPAFAVSQRNPSAQSNAPDSSQRRNTQPAATAAVSRSVSIGP